VAVGARNTRGQSPNEKLNIACVGVGGRGRGNLDGVHSENIVALCDVDHVRAEGAFKRYPDVPKFDDYRRLFDRLHGEIDAVVVSTPDHMHAPITLAAMELGKHVYCEKPLVHTIHEAREVGKAAAKYKNLATQMGNGGNARDGARRSVELIRAGVLGPVREVHAWSDRPAKWWPQGIDRPKEGPAVPDTLAWDLWLGVAPKRPYNPAYLPFKWRGWYDFGTGALGDMGCHICNVAFWGLELADPVAVECEASDHHEETFPEWSKVVWEFPAVKDRPAVKFHWYDGGQKPSSDLVAGHGIPDNGSIIVGEKGTLFLPSPDGTNGILLPEDRFADFIGPSETIPRSPGHHEEWIEACKLGHSTEAMSHFGRAAIMTEAVLIGNLAVRTGKRIEWNAREMKVRNVPEANAYINPPYRKGWVRSSA
jgi:predicted dehydrogenase